MDPYRSTLVEKNVSQKCVGQNKVLVLYPLP